MLTVFRLALVLTAFAGLTRSQNGCPNTKEACHASRTCHWSEDDSCTSSLPCALEISQQACASNTGNCVWISAAQRCERNNKRRGATSPCTSLSKDDCGSLKTCSWNSQLDACRQRPDIIISLADDLGWYDIGWNNPRARSPVLDRLRKMGVGLNRHYTSRFCSPTRAMILTGRHPWKIGLQTDANMNPAQALRVSQRGIEPSMKS
jgi:hypothetical protein